VSPKGVKFNEERTYSHPGSFCQPLEITMQRVVKYILRQGTICQGSSWMVQISRQEWSICPR
jgi:hypothetical protein